MLFDKKGVEQVIIEEEVSLEANALMIEGMLQDTLNPEEILEFTSSPQDTRDAIELGIVTERTIVKLDKYATLSKMQKIAVVSIAKERKDPIWKQLRLVWQMERHLEAVLLRKYGMEGLKRAKKMVATASTKPSPKVIKKAINRAKNQLNAATSATTIRRSKDRVAKTLAQKLNSVPLK